MTDPGAFADLLEEQFRALRSAERILAAISALEWPIKSIAQAVENDAEISPEVRVALDHLQGACDALNRAFMFVSARTDANTERLMRRL